MVPGAYVRKAARRSFAHCTDPRHCLPISYTLFGGESAGIAGPAPGKAAVKSATVRAEKQAEPKIDDLSGDISADDTLLDEEVNVDTVRQEETPESSADTTVYPACKPWMDYRAVTDTASLQYELISQASHEDNGLLTIDGYYLAALGSAWGEVGSRYEMRIGDKTVRLIKADEKQDAHTLKVFSAQTITVKIFVPVSPSFTAVAVSVMLLSSVSRFLIVPISGGPRL